MDKNMIAAKVSARSGISEEDCKKVIDSFEEVLSEELESSKSLGKAFNRVYNIMNFFKNKKEK